MFYCTILLKRLTEATSNPYPMAPVSKTLVIVESPAKARTIAYLPDYFVESSIGHIRDRSNGQETSASRKGTVGPTWRRCPKRFQLAHRRPDKRAHITKLKKLVKEAEWLLATDEDREGESIAWHLLEVL